MIDHIRDIDLSDEEYREVMALVERYIPWVEVWVYGSRVKHTAKPYSDLDMVAFASGESVCAVADLREAFEDSYLPFRVDLFIWKEIPEEFKEVIRDEHVVLQEKK